ncbi:hypothetical protein D3C76_590700 [compost metagenome]
MLHERRAPGRQRHRIDQRQAAVVLAVEQMAAQGCGPAEVVGHHVRAIQAPVFQQLRHQRVLHTQGDVAIDLFRLPVAQQVEVVHPVRGDEMRCNTVPDKGREGRAMHEHQRRAIATHGVANGMPIEAIALSQRPVSHVRILSAGASQKA